MLDKLPSKFKVLKDGDTPVLAKGNLQTGFMDEDGRILVSSAPAPSSLNEINYQINGNVSGPTFTSDGRLRVETSGGSGGGGGIDPNVENKVYDTNGNLLSETVSCKIVKVDDDVYTLEITKNA